MGAAALLVLLTACGQGDDRDGVRPTAFPSSMAQLQEDIHVCMEAEGWDSELQSDGSYRFSYEEAQSDAFNAANVKCIDDAGGNLPIVRSDEDWRGIYDFYLGSVECLRSNGEDVPDAPSFTVWEESNFAWAPYATVNPANMTMERFLELTTACPQTPE